MSVGMPGQVISLVPSQEVWLRLLSVLAFGRYFPTFKCETRSQDLAAMTFDVFFWYVFPLIVAAGAFGWIAYDHHISR